MIQTLSGPHPIKKINLIKFRHACCCQSNWCKFSPGYLQNYSFHRDNSYRKKQSYQTIAIHLCLVTMDTIRKMITNGRYSQLLQDTQYKDLFRLDADRSGFRKWACVNTEIGIFLSLCGNTTVCHRLQHQMHLL